jgi:hypothetical protein
MHREYKARACPVIMGRLWEASPDVSGLVSRQVEGVGVPLQPQFLEHRCPCWERCKKMTVSRCS